MSNYRVSDKINCYFRSIKIAVRIPAVALGHIVAAVAAAVGETRLWK